MRITLSSLVVVAGCAGGATPALQGPAGQPAGDVTQIPPCGSGSWRPGALEIHHIDLGQADATLIVGPTGRSLLVDAGESRWDADAGARLVGDYVRAVLGCARLDQVLLTHFHLDHVGYPGKGGLWHLIDVQGFVVGRTVHRDLYRYVGDASSTLGRWRGWLAAGGAAQLRAEVARQGDGQIDLGPGVRFTIVAVDGNGALRPGDFSADRTPPSENDYSVAALLRYGRFDYFLGGDLSGESLVSMFGYAYHDIEVTVAPKLPDVDVYRVSHHGSDHSSSPTLLAQIDPEVSIASLGDGNSFGHPRPALIDRLLATGALYMTGRGDSRTAIGTARVTGHVVVKTNDGVGYTVGAQTYVAGDPTRIDADGDGYFREADPDDLRASDRPGPRGGCDPVYQWCP